MQLTKKQSDVMQADGHLLVTGGPGSGKTTISILKAGHIAEHHLLPGQKILFMSFARATVSRVVEAIEFEQKIPLARIVELFTAGPTRVVDLRGRGTLARGSYADVTIFDPMKLWTFDASKSLSKSRNTPFNGWQFTGKVVATIVGGVIQYRA